ncbi:unnamed protein product [Rotaria sordida]|uniref:Uncharacterized protein n=1 Tax=Rotaria sordida TaxID=392033 RepID=A0A818LQB2_9BILA|nr:unnamed protein product [Rotaria sordida]CAF0768335.1 unnamed protein product [Rotaria sordida]CAF3582144.1 unnamed protein product [Rotaria sordida]
MLLFTILILILCFINNIYSLSCFKCMTTNFLNDTCSDPFNSIDNRYEHECQATIKGKNGLFPARFCVKISGIIVDIDRNLNRSLIHTNLYLRTCITENIMSSTRASDSTGNFRLKNFADIPGSIKMQGTISLCTMDGCNQANFQTTHILTMLFSFLFFSYWQIN